MDLANLPAPDDLIKSALIRQFGPDAIVVILFSVAAFLKAWLDLGKSSIKLGRLSISAAGSAYTAASRLRPVTFAQGGIVTVVLLTLQSVWLWSAVRVGNDLSYLYTGQWAGPAGWSTHSADITLPRLNDLMSYTSADWISAGYVLVCIAALGASYRTAFGRRPSNKSRIVRWVVALPVMVPWGSSVAVWCAWELVVAGGNGLVNLLTSGESHLTIPDLGWLLVMSLIAPIYIIAANMALDSVDTVSRVWSQGG